LASPPETTPYYIAPSDRLETHMSFRSWRERMLLSQERVAEMSGLSVRTVQRLEAGHRVSYASLRALATAFKTDADLLERELYAVKQPTDEFVEIPRWVRLLNDRLWFGGPRPSRRDFLWVEALCLVLAVIALGSSFLVSQSARAAAVRITAIAPIAGCYLVAVVIRMYDRYRLWPGSENAPPETPRTWRSITAEYAFFIAVATMGILMTAGLFVGF
jgi:transcriptional regulator with XRE-family HTH domain